MDFLKSYKVVAEFLIQIVLIVSKMEFSPCSNSKACLECLRRFFSSSRPSIMSLATEECGAQYFLFKNVLAF